MDAARTLLLALSLATALNWTVHYYTHVVTYRLLPVVAGTTDGAGFVHYHQQYERRLPWAVYLPWTLLTALSVAFLAIRPDGVGLGAAVVLLVLNASIAVLSVALALPVHRRIDERERLTDTDVRALRRVNGARLAAATASLALVTWLAVDQLTT